MLRVLNVLPELLNANGDAENARVLVQRSRWAEVDAHVVSEFDGVPDAVVIGSGFDGDIHEIASGLRAAEPQLSEALMNDVPILAIGLGFELLGDGVVLADGTRVTGLGLVPGEALPLVERAAGDLVVSSAFGLLVGFENHTRGYAIDGATPALGSVLRGVGNSSTPGGREGIMMGSVIGSHLHGPLLAQNPALADAILSRVIGAGYSSQNPRARWADSLAEKARQKILIRAGIAMAERESHDQPEPTEVRP